MADWSVAETAGGLLSLPHSQSAIAAVFNQSTQSSEICWADTHTRTHTLSSHQRDWWQTGVCLCMFIYYLEIVMQYVCMCMCLCIAAVCVCVCVLLTRDRYRDDYDEHTQEYGNDTEESSQFTQSLSAVHVSRLQAVSGLKRRGHNTRPDAFTPSQRHNRHDTIWVVTF